MDSDSCSTLLRNTFGYSSTLYTLENNIDKQRDRQARCRRRRTTSYKVRFKFHEPTMPSRPGIVISLLVIHLAPSKATALAASAFPRPASERKQHKLVFTDNIIDYVLDSGYLPHFVIRQGIRRQLAQRVNMIASTSVEEAYKSKMKYIKLLHTRPMAVETDKANEQHYEVCLFRRTSSFHYCVTCVGEHLRMSILTVLEALLEELISGREQMEASACDYWC